MSNQLVLYFTPHEHPNSEVPFALRTYYSKDVWEKRIPAFTRKASRYYHQVFEWVWFLVFVGAMIGVPIAVNRVAWDHLPEDPNDNKDDHHWWHTSFDRVWKARLIAFASWFAVTLLCYIPIIVWKVIGKKNVNKMLHKWEKEDRALRPNQDLPSWRMRTPGFLSNNIKLVITVPVNAPPSSFHPGSTLPAWIVNGPMDPNAAYYYQQPVAGGYTSGVPASAPLYSQYHPAPGEFPAAPPTSVSGLPLFNERDEKQGGYIPPLDPNADPEKQQFENIRV